MTLTLRSCAQLTSTLRSFRALALQGMRSTVTPENRVDVIQGVICLAYMVRTHLNASGIQQHLHKLLKLAASQKRDCEGLAMIMTGLQ